MTTSPSAVCFASTSLDLYWTDTPDDHSEDTFVESVSYRRVDPEYFAWFRRKMESAKRRFETGRLPGAAWDKMRGLFNNLQEWAISHYGMECLQGAIREFDPAAYEPPVNRQPESFGFPTTGDWRFSKPVLPAAVRKVDAIREVAKTKGWSDERLYRSRGRFAFPLGQDYGLVCFVGPNDEVGEITETHIEIIHDRAGCKNSLRFANSDAFPPRIRKEGASP